MTGHRGSTLFSCRGHDPLAHHYFRRLCPKIWLGIRSPQFSHVVDNSPQVHKIVESYFFRVSFLSPPPRDSLSEWTQLNVVVVKGLAAIIRKYEMVIIWLTVPLKGSSQLFKLPCCGKTKSNTSHKTCFPLPRWVRGGALGTMLDSHVGPRLCPEFGDIVISNWPWYN